MWRIEIFYVKYSSYQAALVSRVGSQQLLQHALLKAVPICAKIIFKRFKVSQPKILELDIECSIYLLLILVNSMIDSLMGS